MQTPAHTDNHRSPTHLCLLGLLLAIGSMCALSCLARPPAPNRRALSGCVACHAPIARQIVGSLHEKAGIGCTTCHGLSNGHMKDGTNLVKPDRVFPRRDVDPFCSGCHLDSCVQAHTKHHGPPITPGHTCADCHGAHAARIPAH